MKLKSVIAAAAMSSLSVAAQAASVATEVSNAAYLHARYVDVMVASDHCPLAIDIKKWDREMPARVMAVVKAFNVTEQGAAWLGKRDDDFKANPAKECADAEKQYGPEGLKLLKRK